MFDAACVKQQVLYAAGQAIRLLLPVNDGDIEAQQPSFIAQSSARSLSQPTAPPQNPPIEENQSSSPSEPTTPAHNPSIEDVPTSNMLANIKRTCSEAAAVIGVIIIMLSCAALYHNYRTELPDVMRKNVDLVASVGTVIGIALAIVKWWRKKLNSNNQNQP